RAHFEDHSVTYAHFEKAASIVEESLKRRDKMFTDLVSTWEEVRLPKGLSTPEKQYFFQQDRARHFANRVPGMEYLIYDEQLLDMEGWLEKLRDYMDWYKKTYLNGE